MRGASKTDIDAAPKAVTGERRRKLWPVEGQQDGRRIEVGRLFRAKPRRLKLAGAGALRRDFV